jgi:hypothetical protein
MNVLDGDHKESQCTGYHVAKMPVVTQGGIGPHSIPPSKVEGVLVEGVLVEGVLVEGVLVEGVLVEGVLVEGVLVELPLPECSPKLKTNAWNTSSPNQTRSNK